MVMVVQVFSWCFPLCYPTLGVKEGKFILPAYMQLMASLRYWVMMLLG
jgi:hypothetical protein